MYNVQWLLFSHMYSVRRYKGRMPAGEGGGGLPVESKFGGDNIPLQRCITFFKIDILRVTLIESYNEFKGGGECWQIITCQIFLTRLSRADICLCSPKYLLFIFHQQHLTCRDKMN